MTAIKLPDALVDALKAHNMQDIEAMEAYATRAIWKQLQEEDSNNSEETEEDFQTRVSTMRERYDQYKRGEFVLAKDYFAQKQAEYEARKQQEQ
jgi:hypothetical protein